MCGIAGLVRFDERFDGVILGRRVERMTAALSHRGPNGSGLLVSTSTTTSSTSSTSPTSPPETRGGAAFALGHRRLSIIDLEGGAQPMSLDGRRIHIVFNGEIYNYRELRAELSDRGVVFRTRSDTEVILAVYDAWGTAGFERLRGMFAFVIVDEERRRFVLARDLFGIKPLVFSKTDEELVFASEMGALAEGRLEGSDPPDINLPALDLYLKLQYIPAPHTALTGVEKVEPGGVVVVDFDGAVTKTRRRPAPFHEDDAKIDGVTWLEQLERALDSSVRAHLVADVDIGAFLSGGVDSTLVVAHMARLHGQRVVGYTIGFREDGFSELPYAAAAAKELGVELRSELLDDSALEQVASLIAHCGEPFGDSSIIPTWAVSRLASRDVRVVLSGDGGDELFGGYHSYVALLERARLPDRESVLHALKARRLRPIARNAWHSARHRGTSELAVWESIVAYFNDDERSLMWRSEHRHAVGAPASLSPWVDGGAADPLSFAQRLDMETYLPGDILTKVDIASMSVGLEARPPLLDPEVYEVARRLPSSLRMGPGLEQKPLLKAALARFMPRAFVDRKKMGFGLPMAAWMSPGRKGFALFHDAVAGSGIDELIHPSAIQDLIIRQRAGHDVAGRMWLILVLALWLRSRKR